MFYSMMRTFLPWIIYYLLYRVCDVSVAISATVTLIIFIVIGYRDLWQGFIICWLSPIFLIVIMLNARYFHWEIFQCHAAAILYAMFAIVGWGSIILKVPFTLQYSRVNVAQDKWQHPLFLKINYMLSLCWSLIFSSNLAINSLPSANYFRLAPYALTIIGLYITLVFPDWYRKLYIGSEK